MRQEDLNSLMRLPGEVIRHEPPKPAQCPSCGERYCGDGKALCLECQAAPQAQGSLAMLSDEQIRELCNAHMIPEEEIDWPLIRAIESAVLAGLGHEGREVWQPIETAPRDGTVILLADMRGRVANGEFGNYKVWSWPYVMVEPTHWMPLLQPPEQAQDAQGSESE